VKKESDDDDLGVRVGSACELHTFGAPAG
jgi:hypothetical protein